MSAPFGHVTVPPSIKKRAKKVRSFKGSKTGPESQSEKSSVASTPSLKTTWILKSPQYSARTTAGRRFIWWGVNRVSVTFPSAERECHTDPDRCFSLWLVVPEVIGVHRRLEKARQKDLELYPRLSAARKTGFRIKDRGFSVLISVCFRVILWLNCLWFSSASFAVRGGRLPVTGHGLGRKSISGSSLMRLLMRYARRCQIAGLRRAWNTASTISMLPRTRKKMV